MADEARGDLQSFIEHGINATMVENLKKKPEVYSSGSGTVIGEVHLRMFHNQEAEDTVKTALASADIVCTEFRADFSSVYSEQSIFTPYMEQAIIHATQKRKTLVVLDEQIPENRCRMWAEQGIPLKEDDILMGSALR